MRKDRRSTCAGYLGHLFGNRLTENNSPNRFEQIVADNRNIYGSGNSFILPVIPELENQGMLREQLKFNFISSI
jgi:hypothetical protein